MVREYLLSTDNFMNPRVIKGMDAIGVLIVRLLMLIPGTNTLHPKMGVGIGSVYKYITSDDLVDLQLVIDNQINTYLSSVFSNARTSMKINEDKALVISIILDNTEYVFDTSLTENPVTLSDI